MSTYAAAGVNLDDARKVTERLKAIVGAARTPGVLADVGAFGGMFSLRDAGVTGDPVLVASTDGVGTKVKIAAGLGRYDTIGVDLVNHCINDIAVQGATPLFFLDYLGIHRADPDIVAAVVAGVAAACAEAGIALIGGETAEMPDVYSTGELDLAGTIVGVMDRSAINRNGIPTSGDVIIGLPSSGLHTNGYSLARRVLPETSWQEAPPMLGSTIGEALLTPHRCYLQEIRALETAGARGIAHITGGGFPDNVDRVLPKGLTAVIDVAAWQPQPIFQILVERGGISRDEAYGAFNMGIGLTACLPEANLDAALVAVPEAEIIGRVEPAHGRPPVVLIGSALQHQESGRE